MSIVLTSQPVVTYKSANAALVRLIGQPSQFVLADGVSVARVKVWAYDTYGNPVTGVTPNVTVTGTNNVITGPAATDANGFTSFTVSTTTPQNKTASVTFPSFSTQNIALFFVAASSAVSSVADPVSAPTASATNVPSFLTPGVYNVGYTWVTSRGETGLSPTTPVTVGTMNAFNNPVSAPSLSIDPTVSDLPPGTYKVGYTYRSINGGETLLSPTATITLGLNQSIKAATVPAPTVTNPSGDPVAVFVGWYISRIPNDTTSGTLRLATVAESVTNQTIISHLVQTSPFFTTSDPQIRPPSSNTAGVPQSINVAGLSLPTDVVGVRLYISQTGGSAIMRYAKPGVCFNVDPQDVSNGEVFTGELKTDAAVIFKPPQYGLSASAEGPTPPNASTISSIGIPVIQICPASGQANTQISVQTAGWASPIASLVMVFPYGISAGNDIGSLTTVNGITTCTFTIPNTAYSGQVYVVQISSTASQGFTITADPGDPLPQAPPQLSLSSNPTPIQPEDVLTINTFDGFFINRVTFSGGASGEILGHNFFSLSVRLPSTAANGPVTVWFGEGRSATTVESIAISGATVTPTPTSLLMTTAGSGFIANNTKRKLNITVFGTISGKGIQVANQTVLITSNVVSDVINQPPLTGVWDPDPFVSNEGNTVGSFKATKNQNHTLTAHLGLLTSSTSALTHSIDRLSPAKSALTTLGGGLRFVASNSPQGSIVVSMRDLWGNFADTTWENHSINILSSVGVNVLSGIGWDPVGGVPATTFNQDVSGNATFQLVLKRAGLDLIVIRDGFSTSGIILASFLVLTTPGAPTGAQISSSFQPFQNHANGTDKATITVTIVDFNNNPIPGVNVLIAASGSGNIITQPTQPTDASGKAVALLATTVSGTKNITVTANGNPMPGSINVTFVP
jgi:hypothetical protein